jgi:hypothetical protein
MTRVGNHQPCWDPRSPHRTQISFVDVSRAYFNAKVDQDDNPCFVELPAEDPDCGKRCGRLVMHMYGTRPAADGWQEEYSTLLISLGFRQGVSCPNVFYHEDKQIACSVHGDDFTSSGPCDALTWMEQSIAEKYEVTIGPRLGPGENDEKEARALNRIIRWCDDRIEYEADPRQAERLIEECGLAGCKTVATPGVRASFQELETDVDLPEKLHTAFRGASARANYLAADRIDCMFASKEVCRWMAKPTHQSWIALKRLCRFLSGLPRLVYTYRKQTIDKIDVYTDTDWAGCPKTRKSTSGGVVMLGQHTIKHWASTQASVSLSSGEAEFGGVIRGAGQGLGFQALLADFGVDVPLRMWTDSSAAIGISTRQGLGKLRHLDTQTLWIQQAIRCRRIDLRKVLGTENPADLLTKHSISKDAMVKLVGLYECRYLEGRAKSAPLVKQGASNGRMTLADAKDELGTVMPAQADGIGRDGDVHNPNYWMPHKELEADELDAMYPPLVAPDEENLHDVNQADDDPILVHGFKIAKQIESDMVRYGRTRRLPKDGAQLNNGGDVGDNDIGHIDICDEAYDDDHNDCLASQYNFDGHRNDNSYDYNHDCNHDCNNDASSASSVFLSDDNQSCPNSFPFCDSSASSANIRSADTGPALEVRALHSLSLWGSAKSSGTVCSIMANTSNNGICTDGVKHVHAGNVWLKSLKQRCMRSLPLCVSAC